MREDSHWIGNCGMQVRDLFRESHTISQIARRMQLTWRTVRNFAGAETFPERAPRTGEGSQLDGLKPYLCQRWREGCHNAHTLWKEVAERGYGGCYTMVKAHLRTLRQPPRHRKRLLRKRYLPFAT